MSERRVVVTGYGVQSCVGCDVPSFWDALVNGRCGLGKVTFFDASAFRTRIAGEIPDFDPTRYMSPKEAKRVDRFCQLAIAATDEAMKTAELPADLRDGAAVDPTRVGVLVSSGIGGLHTLGEQFRVLFEKGNSRVSPLLIPMMISDLASGNT